MKKVLPLGSSRYRSNLHTLSFMALREMACLPQPDTLYFGMIVQRWATARVGTGLCRAVVKTVVCKNDKLKEAQLWTAFLAPP